MEENIFTVIMNLIEKSTDMPILQVDIEEWIQDDEENKTIYEIYSLASKARQL